MSHFSVIVALPGGTAIDKVKDLLHDVMAPWNENTEVEPYRVYEEGGPEDHWWVQHVRRAADHHKNGTGIKPYNPEMFASFSTAESRETPEQQAAAIAEDAAWSERLGEHPTWEQVITLYKERYGDGDSECPLYDPDSGRAYTMSTYNPESKWDYWGIGGRAGGKFIAKPGADVIQPSRRWDSPDRIDEPLRCDGGAIKDLDFAAMRDACEVRAFAEYRKWEELLAHHGPAKPWSHFHGLAEIGEITWEEARKQYGQQPLVKAASKEYEALGTDPIGCPVEHFKSPRFEYIAEARRAAVPGYALVTLKGEWVSSGRMGWFGMSSESADEYSAYRIAANKYFDSLSEDTVLVAVDCHI